MQNCIQTQNCIKLIPWNLHAKTLNFMYQLLCTTCLGCRRCPYGGCRYSEIKHICPFVKYGSYSVLGSRTWLVVYIHMCVYVFICCWHYKVHGKLCVCLKHYILLSVGFVLMKMEISFFHIQLFWEAYIVNCQRISFNLVWSSFIIFPYRMEAEIYITVAVFCYPVLD